MPVEKKNIGQLQALSRQNNDEGVNALLQLSEHYNRKRSKIALSYAKRALEHAVSINNQSYIAKAHIQLATYFSRSRTDYFASMKHSEKALSLQQFITSKHDLAEIYKITGINYHYIGDINRAQHSYMTALDIMLSIHSRSKDETKDVADLYYNLAILNKGEDANELRRTYLEQAQKYYAEIGNMNGQARCADGMAVYWFYAKDYKQSLVEMERALSIFMQIKDNEGTYLTYNNIGTLKIQDGKFEEGLDYLHRSLKLRKETGNPVSIAISYINIGNAWIDKKKYKEALTYLRKAEVLLRQAENRVQLAALMQSMSKCYDALGQHRKAYKAIAEYAEYRDSLHRFELKKAYSDTKLQYDIELMERDALIDRLQNFEIASYIHKLEISNNELKQFAHIASHDLKEPLRTITGFANLLEKGYKDKLDAQAVEYIRYITTGAKRLNELVKDILNLSRINTVEQSLSQVDLNEVAKEVTAHIRTLVSEKKATVKYGKLPTIHADKTQMFQLFLNLIVNGIKYNNSGKPHINIKCSKDGSNYRFNFSDNGIGIPEEYHEKVFEIFQRLHDRTSYSGTGIGLTLCKKIVDRHKGRIWVEKNHPQGSTFIVQLPAQ
jgi:signal transduction histidine kinase